MDTTFYAFVSLSVTLSGAQSAAKPLSGMGVSRFVMGIGDTLRPPSPPPPPGFQNPTACPSRRESDAAI